MLLIFASVQFSSVAQSCPTLCDPSTPGLPAHRHLLEFTQTHVHRVRDAILCRPLLLLPPIPPSIRVFSSESTLRMRCPKYWSFSFSIIPSKEIPGLISFRIGVIWLNQVLPGFYQALWAQFITTFITLRQLISAKMTEFLTCTVFPEHFW